MTQPWQLSAQEAAQLIREGSLTSVRLVESCLERIYEREPEVKAWTHFDAEAALATAYRLDRQVSQGSLYGIPVGIKDVINTKDFRTEYNSSIYTGHFPAQDADIVQRISKAGMVVIGKTVTQEFATRGNPGPTRNPWNLNHTPGGSSSGSAAAIAAGMIPLAISTQTAGSIIRPASYCGVVGYKPTFGFINTAGLKVIVPEADTIGFHSRTFDDAALALSVLSDSFNLADYLKSIPSDLKIGIFNTSFWNLAENETRLAISIVSDKIEQAEGKVINCSLPFSFEKLSNVHDLISDYRALKALSSELFNHPEKLSNGVHEKLLRAQKIKLSDFNSALRERDRCTKLTDELFKEFDFILTPSSPGVAPEFSSGNMGDSIFSKVWTLLGLPAVNIPVSIKNKLPIGIQLLGPRNHDGRVLQAAKKIQTLLAL